MRKLIILTIAGAAVAAVAAVAVTAVLMQQPPVNNSAQSIRFFYQREYRNSDYKFQWDSNAIGSNSSTDINSMFTCPDQSTEVMVFLSLRGEENKPDGGWQAFSPTSFFKSTKKVLTPNLKPAGLIGGTPGSKYSRDKGGDYSLGLACTHNQGKAVDRVSYRFITVTPHTGEWSALAEPDIKTAK